ncbi:MAG: GNAT family N-acetyltransferase [Pseudomonadota bacterium]
MWSDGISQAAQSPGNLFLEQDWREAYAKHQPNGVIEIHELRQGETRLALSVAPERMRRVPCTVLRVLGDPLADQCWFGTDVPWDCSQAVTALRQGPAWDVAVFSELCMDESDRATLDRAIEATGLRGHWRQCGRAPVVPLSGRDKPLTDADYSSTLRRRLKRSRKKLDQAGHVTIVHKLPKADEVPALIETLKGIEDASWKGDADTGLFNAQRLGFVHDLSERLARRGQLEIYLLLLDDTPISYRYGFRYGNRFLDYNLAYLSEYHHLSPGRILLDEIVKTSQALGLEAVDASRGSLERPHILADWPGYIRDHHRLTLFAPTPKGRLLHFIETRVRPLVLGLKHRIAAGEDKAK